MARNYRTLWLNDVSPENSTPLQDFINHGFTPPLYGVIDHLDNGQIARGFTYVDTQKRLKQWLPEDAPPLTIVNNSDRCHLPASQPSKPLAAQAENDKWLFFIRQ